MGHNVKSRLAGSIAVVFLAAGCGGGAGPQDALDAFVDAINNRDDKAVQDLTCTASHKDHSGTLSDPFKGNPMGVDVYEIEPRLRDLRYVANGGDIVAESDATATGKVDITVEGAPDDLAPEAQQVMESSQIAFPLMLINPKDDTVKLVKEGDAWVVCG